MASKKINIGVVGLGRIGWDYHCKQILKNKKKYNLVAVEDASVERCKEAAESLGCKAYSNYEAFLNHPGLQAVVIATPTHMHKVMTIQALNKGLDVILEKPMTSDSKEAKAIIAVAKKKKAKLTVYQPARLADYFQHLKKIINSKILGEVYHIKINRYKFQRRDDWQSVKKFGGGMLANYGSHVLGQLLELIGTDTKKTFCTLRCVATLGDADDVVKIVTQTKSGVIGEVDINSASFAEPQYLEVYGTLGALTMKDEKEFVIKSFQKKELVAKKLDATLQPKDRKYPRDNITAKDKIIAVDPKYKIDLYENFYDSVIKNKPLAVQPAEVLEVVKFIDECKKIAGKNLETRL
jgi:scyllo-inositol 2-dehydrogenase (NADP+)